jgi:hypothetical protein
MEMQMNTTATARNAARQLGYEIFFRALLALAWGACYLFGEHIVAPVKDGFMQLVIHALLELFTIQAMFGLFGNSPLVRDANEINFYGFLAHLLALPSFLLGISSSYHNNTIWALIGLYFVRLCWFGKRQADGRFPGWATFGLLAYSQQWLYTMVARHNAQRLLFSAKLALAAVTLGPLWGITMTRHDGNTTLFTIIGTSLIFAYGFWRNLMATEINPPVAPETANAKASAAATRAASGVATGVATEAPALATPDSASPLLTPETIELCKTYHAHSRDAQLIIRRIVTNAFAAQEELVAQQRAEAFLEKMVERYSGRLPALSRQAIIYAASFDALPEHEQRFVALHEDIKLMLQRAAPKPSR